MNINYSRFNRNAGFLFSKAETKKIHFFLFFTPQGEIIKLLTRKFDNFYLGAEVGDFYSFKYKTSETRVWKFLVEVDVNNFQQNSTKILWKQLALKWITDLQQNQTSGSPELFQFFLELNKMSDESWVLPFIKTMLYVLEKASFNFNFNYCGDCHQKSENIKLYWALDNGGVICESCRWSFSNNIYSQRFTVAENEILTWVKTTPFSQLRGGKSDKFSCEKIINFLFYFLQNHSGFTLPKNQLKFSKNFFNFMSVESELKSSNTS